MTFTTGWPPGLLQDDDRKLSRWFAGRPGARRQAELVALSIKLHHPRNAHLFTAEAALKAFGDLDKTDD